MIISCCLIGEDSLLIQCGDILLTQGCWIERIVSNNGTIQEWAQKNNVLCVSTLDELLKSHFNTVDYIFSIVNSYILTSEVLKLARHGAVNYHDSLLPKYAGLNSTTWAIINNEHEHGVTWHVVTEKIDEGDILKQVKFPIYPEDTAFTLNLRCYEHAIQSFNEMLTELMTGKVQFIKQELKHRSYFGIGEMLQKFGFIDWNSFSAAFIQQLSRATTLGHYNNNVGLLKIYLKIDYVIVLQCSVANIDTTGFEPGTLIDISDNAIYVATITTPIKLEHFISKTGHSISIDSLINLYNLQIGMKLTCIEESDIDFKDLYVHAAKSERYWLNQLKNMTEHATFSPASLENHAPLKKLNEKITIPPMLFKMAEERRLTIILTAILTYLFRLNNYENTSVSLIYNNYSDLESSYGCLFSSFLPFVTDWGAHLNLEDLIKNVSKHLKKISKSHTFSTDIAARHPLLNNVKCESDIIVNLLGSKITLPQGTLLYFEYDEKNKEIVVSHRVSANYHSHLLTETLHHLSSHIMTILNYLMTKPHVKVSEFCFLTALERKKLLTVWGRGKKFTLPRHSLAALFTEQASINPNKTAIFMGSQSITYAELDHMSDKIAFSIKQLKLPSQSLIGIYIHRSVEMLAIIIGILKADCVYVPLDTKYPLLKIETIANEAQLSYLITANRFKDQLVHYFKDKQIINFYTVESILSPSTNNAASVKKIKTSLKHLAYIMFTSGTTGIPKGVVVTQKNILNYCSWFINTTNFNSSSIIDFSSSIAFDLSIPCTIAPLISGGSIAICEDMEKMNPELYLQHLRKYKVTHAELTPGYVELLLHYPGVVKQLVDLKYLLLGADTLHTQEVTKWLELCPHHQVVNEYGPTETTVSVTSYFVDREKFSDEVSVPIGKPAFNSTAYILDKYENLCPIGMKGELYIGGHQVTNGYLRKPTLTEEKFIPSAFNDMPEILYRTGDLAAWLPGGNIQFFGRNDFQVKIQGYRIELPAIESTLLKIPTIEQAVVVVRKGSFKERYLRAYVVTNDTQISMGEIKRFLSAHLPNYMIPKEFCVIPFIPLKENEKIDLGALEKQAHTLLTFEHEINTALSDNENIVMRAWHHAFNTTNISQLDDFFSLGGDSLLALQVIGELKQYYKIDIPLFYLFEYPTVATFTSKLEALLQENSTSIQMIKHAKSVVRLSEGNHKTPLFLVHPVGGSVFWYKQLADCLSSQFSIYGIQDPSIDGDSMRFKTLEEMAAFYIQELCTLYEGEPIAIAGASFGATVAVEMANQLMTANKKVKFLGLLDGWAIYPESLMQRNTVDLLSFKEGHVLDEAKKQQLGQLEDYRKNLLLNYKLKSISVDTTLYKAAELWEDFILEDDINNGWTPYVNGKFTRHIIPGNHETMLFKPNVDNLANQLLMDLKFYLNR